MTYEDWLAAFKDDLASDHTSDGGATFQLWDDSAPSEEQADMLALFLNDAERHCRKMGPDWFGQASYELLSCGMTMVSNAFTSPDLSEKSRLRVIASLYHLHDPVAVHYCGNQFCKGQRKDRLGFLTYMLFDICCMTPKAMRIDGSEVYVDAVLEVQRRILALPSFACQEGALHGLSHWHDVQTAPKVQQIVDDYLRREISLPKELRSYAKICRRGGAL